MKSEKIYLDYAASTPVDPRVLKAIEPYWSEKFGNPGSVHSFGQEALGAVDKARETVAKSISAGFREIIFTGSATESNNLTFRGTIRKFWWNFFNEHSSKSKDKKIQPHVITTAIEHESVLETLGDIERRGAARVTILPVNHDGIVEISLLKKALKPETVLVSVMYVNNEIGSVQPISEIAEIIRNFKNSKHEILNSKQIPNSKFKTQNNVSDFGFRNSDLIKKYPLFHVDASQAFNYFDCDAEKLGVDLMTLSGQKIYGPKGIGMLYVRNPKLISPLITGGGQEFGLRSGTENVSLIIGFAKAVELANKERKQNIKKVIELKKTFWNGLKKFYPEAQLNGKSEIPHILNIYFPTEFAGDLIVKLDMIGIAVSAGSACTARAYTPSYVLQSLGLSPERVRGSLRFSFGKNLSLSEIKIALKRIEGIIR